MFLGFEEARCNGPIFLEDILQKFITKKAYNYICAMSFYNSLDKNPISQYAAALSDNCRCFSA